MIFFLLFSSVVAGMNAYLWKRLVRDTRLTGAAFWAATALLLALTASMPLTLVIWARVNRSLSPTLNYVAFGWLGIAFYLLLLLLCWDVLRAGSWLSRRVRRRKPPSAAEASTPSQPGVAASEGDTRRVFLARSAATGALAAVGGITAFGVRSALWDITTPETAVALPRLPRALDGFSIALLTDIHIGPLLDGRFLTQLVEETNRLRPDLIALGGDLVDGHVHQIGPQLAPLARLRARYGVYFVTGNHEYYSGVEDWLEYMKRLGIRVLMNERVSIGQEGPGAKAAATSFDLAGVPDFRAAQLGRVGPDLATTVAGRDPERELVVLAHQPLEIGASSLAGAGLQLSGHTHGGQLYPFGALTRLVQPYIAGLHRHHTEVGSRGAREAGPATAAVIKPEVGSRGARGAGPATAAVIKPEVGSRGARGAGPATAAVIHPDTITQIYVSCGSGFWGPPMRVLAPAEISLLRLHST